MFKKTLLSVAVASTLGLTGCLSDGGSGSNADPDYKIEDTTIDTSLVRPIYNPNPLAAEAAFPINSDLILLLGATLSANFDFTGTSSGTSPADDAVNRLSGFSPSGVFSQKFNGELNPDSVLANATVFLVPLNVAPAIETAPEALPATNPSGIIADNPFLTDPALQPKFRADLVSLDGGVNNTIRIVPLEPLLDGQKYLLVVSSDVQGANGKPIARSIQDKALADGTLGNPALANVKSLLQNSDALGNGFLAAMGVDAESALAYSFTTNADTDVLKAMMAPPAFASSLGQKIGFTAQLKAVRDNFPSLNFSQLTTKLGEIAEKAAKLQAGELDPATLTTAELKAITRLGELATITTPTNIGSAITAEIGSSMHLPQPRPSFFYDAEAATTLTTIASLDLATNPIAQAATQVKVSQGAIELPYYQHLPGESGAGITEGSWAGSTTLEANLNESLAPGGEVFKFLRDTDGKLNVNGYFPFPEQRATTTVPVVIFHPVLDDSAAEPLSCATSTGKPLGVTIFQHGITVDRSASMLPAILLAQATCQAVIAIDQPLHGLAGAQVGTIPGLETLDEATLKATVNATIDGLANVGGTEQLRASLASLIDADYIGERHFNFTANEQNQPIAADLADVESGSLFINPLNMLNSRDNLRQSVVDLMNVAATIQTFDIDGDFNTRGDLAGIPVNFVGHSLGGISGTTFASITNDTEAYDVQGNAITLNQTVNATYAQGGLPFSYPSLTSVVLHNTSGQTTRLIENSPAFSGALLGGLAAAGVTQGSSDFENFFYVFQSVVDATDPVNFAESLGESTPNILITEVIGDNTVPNEANIEPLGSAFSAPLTGTEPLMALLDLGAGGTELADGTEGLAIIDSSSPGAPMPAAAFFAGTNPCSDANHGTFVAPQAPNDNCPGGVANTAAAFSAMITQTGAAITGQTIPGIALPEIGGQLGTSTTIEFALDQDE